MAFTKADIKQAYIKLKSYVYYDNTDIILRRQLVEFETSIGKDFLFNNPSSYYNIGGYIFGYKYSFTLEEKFERITTELNDFHKGSKFFEAILSGIDINFYPKKIKAPKEDCVFQPNRPHHSDFV
jgi:hypothetical protein